MPVSSRSRCAIMPVVSDTGVGPDLAGKAAGGRRLVAVVYADMVGYSRLISLDDAGTLRRLRTLRCALIDPAIRAYGGKVVQTGGDSPLVAFDSIDGAVRCAVKVQQQVPVTAISRRIAGSASASASTSAMSSPKGQTYMAMG